MHLNDDVEIQFVLDKVKVFSSEFARSLYSRMYNLGVQFLSFAKTSTVFDKYVKLGAVFVLTGAMGLAVVSNAPSLLDEGVAPVWGIPSFISAVNAVGLESDGSEMLEYKLDPYYEAVLESRLNKDTNQALKDRLNGVSASYSSYDSLSVGLGLDSSWMVKGCPFDELANSSNNGFGRALNFKSCALAEQTRTVVSGGIGSSANPSDIFRELNEKDEPVVFTAASKESELGIDEGTELQGEMFKAISQAVSTQKYLLSEWLKRSVPDYDDKQFSSFIDKEPSESDLQWIANKLMLQLQRTEVGDKDISVQLGYVNRFLQDWFKCVQTQDSVIEGDKLVSHEKYSIMYDGETVLKNNFVDVDLSIDDSEVLKAIARFDKQSQIAYQAVYQDYQVSAPGKFEDIKLGLPLKSDNISSLISSEFGSRDALSFGNGLKKHTGTDFATKKGTKIYAAQSGKVVKLVRSGYGYGNYLIIDHDGYQTLYAHCNKLLVNLGDEISMGQEIAEVGCTGWSTGNHLHFEVIYDSTQLDPMQFLSNPVTSASVPAQAKLDNPAVSNVSYKSDAQVDTQGGTQGDVQSVAKGNTAVSSLVSDVVVDSKIGTQSTAQSASQGSSNDVQSVSVEKSQLIPDDLVLKAESREVPKSAMIDSEVDTTEVSNVTNEDAVSNVTSFSDTMINTEIDTFSSIG